MEASDRRGHESGDASRDAAVALVVYAALVLSLLTPLYEPLTAGRDDTWALLALVVVAHLGLGAAVRRWWVLGLPAAVAIGAFVVNGAEGTAWMALLFGGPALIGVTAAGVGLGRRWFGRATVLVLAMAALVVPAWAAVETARRGPHVPEAVQRQLPTDVSLGNLCPGADNDPTFEQDVRRRGEALLRELRLHPNHLVTVVEYSSHGDDSVRDMTVKELAEEQLADLESPPGGCAPGLERRLRAAL